MKLRVNLILFFIILSGSVLHAAGSAYLSTEFYSYEADTLSHNRFYQSLRLDYTLYQKQFKKTSFHTYTKWSTDFSDQFENDPLLNVYNAYFKFKNFIPKTSFQIGRQFVYNPSGSALVDGLMFRTKKINGFFWQVFGGSSVRRMNPDEVQPFADNLTGGSRLSYTLSRGQVIGLNWFYRKDAGEVVDHRLGTDINYRPNRQWYFYSKLSYNHLTYSINDFLLRTTFRKSDWYLLAEFKLREPSVNPNSVFAIIDFQKYKRVRLSIQKNMNKKFTIVTQMYYAIYDTDNSLSGSVGFRTANYSLNYHFQSGRSESNGLTGSINYQLPKNLTIYGTANISRYKIQSDYDDLSDAYTTALGLAKRFNHSWQIKTEWQYLRNADEKQSSRIYLKINKGFSIN